MIQWLYMCMYLLGMDLCDAYDIYDVDTNTCDVGCDAMWCSYDIYVMPNMCVM